MKTKGKERGERKTYTFDGLNKQNIRP